MDLQAVLCPPSGSTSGPQLLLYPPVPRFLLGRSSLWLRRGCQVQRCHRVPSAFRAPPPSAPSPSLVPMMSMRASRPCFLPPSTLQWSSFLAGLWAPTLPLMLLVPLWLLPPSTSPWTVLFAPDCVCSRPLPRPPPEPCPPSLVGPCKARGRASPEGGCNVTFVSCFQSACLSSR